MNTKITKKLFEVYEYLVKKGETEAAKNIKNVILDIIAQSSVTKYVPICPIPPTCPTPYPTPWEQHPWYDGVWCNIVENDGDFNSKQFIEEYTNSIK